MTAPVRFRSVALLSALAVLLVLVGPAAGKPTAAASTAAEKAKTDTAVLFAADGLRQDIVARYAAQGLLPTMSRVPQERNLGDRQRAADPGAAEHGRGLVQPRHRRLAGRPRLHEQHVPHQRPARSRTATTAFDPNVLQAESIAQSAERGGLKVAQVEWAGGRNASIQGPTIDFRTFLSGRGVATNFIGQAGDVLFDDVPFITAFGLQFDHPAGYAGQAPFPGAAPTPATGWTGALPATFSPPREMRMRVLDFGVDKYGLNAWIFDSTNDGTTNYDKVLFSRTKSAADTRRASSRKGEWADVKVKISRRRAQRPDRRHADQGRGADARPLARPALPHLGQPRDRDLADVAGRAGLHRRLRRVPRAEVPDLDGRRLRGPRGGRRLRGDVRRAGPVLEDRPTSRCSSTSSRSTTRTCSSSACRRRTSSSTSSSGSSRPSCRAARRNPAFDDVDLNRVPDGRVAAREAFIRTAYEEADEVLTRARELMGKDPTTFVASDHGFAPQFLAIDASKPLVDLGLLSRPQTSNCRPATGETIGKAKACWAGGALQIYLNVAGRDPAGGGFQQVAAADVAATVAAIKAKYLGLADPNDWTGDGQPEGWKMIDRVFTKAEARYIPNGPGSTTDMAHPTRTGDVLVFSYPAVPVRRGDAGHAGRAVALLRPARLRPGRPGPPREHQHAGDVPGRRRGDREGQVTATHDRPRADARVPARDPGAAAQPGPGPARRRQGRELVQAALDRRAERLPRPARPDDARRSTGIAQPVGGAAFLATMFDEEFAALPAGISGPACSSPAGDNVGASPPNSALLAGHAGDRRRERVGPRRDVLRQPRVRLRRRPAARAPGAGELPVPRDEHRRRGDGAGPAVGDAVGRVHGRRDPGRRHRRRAREHAGARLRRCDGRPAVPRRGAADQGGVGAAARRAASASRSSSSTRGRRAVRTRSATRPACRGKARSWGSPTSSRTRRSTR